MHRFTVDRKCGDDIVKVRCIDVPELGVAEACQSQRHVSLASLSDRDFLSHARDDLGSIHQLRLKMDGAMRRDGSIDGTGDFNTARGFEHVDRLCKDIVDENLGYCVEADATDDAARKVIIDCMRTARRTLRRHVLKAGVYLQVEDVAARLERRRELIGEGQIAALVGRQRGTIDERV